MRKIGIGRLLAGLVGGTLFAIAFGLAITIFVPGHNGLDQAFMGGLTLVVVWPLAIVWVLMARSTGRAWTRALVPLLIIVGLDALGLLL